MDIYANQKGENDTLMLIHQGISTKNAHEFAKELDAEDKEILKLIEEMKPEVAIKKLDTQWKKTPLDWLIKIFEGGKAEKDRRQLLESYLERRRSRIFELLRNKRIFISSHDGEPMGKEIQFAPLPARVIFNFKRYYIETRYKVIIKYQDQTLPLREKPSYLLCQNPGLILIDQTIYELANGKADAFRLPSADLIRDKTTPVDGAKVKAFLSKEFISIARGAGQWQSKSRLEDIEYNYYSKFIAGMIAEYEVEFEGFVITENKTTPVAKLILKEEVPGKVLSLMPSLFTADGEEEEAAVPDETLAATAIEDRNLVFQLKYLYGNMEVFGLNDASCTVLMDTNYEEIKFAKTRRDIDWEETISKYLRDKGLRLVNGSASMPLTDGVRWLQTLEEAKPWPFDIIQSKESQHRFSMVKPKMELKITEQSDWFELDAVIQFGDVIIPFRKLWTLIKSGKQHFALPNGEIAVIPAEWYEYYAELFALARKEASDQQEKLVLEASHLQLIQELGQSQRAVISFQSKLQNLKGFTEIHPYPMPDTFKGTLRPYQKAGFDWLRFLEEYKFGGCLADDMGLGKTVQTLALLAAQKEQDNAATSLLIAPTSLIYNWRREAAKFAPELSVHTFIGPYRERDPDYFDQIDVVMTSYGTTRSDIDFLRSYEFHTIILDESQAIKNPGSQIAKCVNQLRAKHRFILTGTPLENSTMDLWSQMNFINPGLLGSQSFFKEHFQLPIEKKDDKDKKRRLHHMIKPFILRRTKDQVATDLPPKIENLHLSMMTPAHREAYDAAKDHYRGLILERIAQEGFAKSQLHVLQGLTQLRQMANHPILTDPDYQGDSGKFEDITYKLEEVLSENHKVLVFSQFVKHLALIKAWLDARKIPYAYLDGSTRDREAQVDKFQNQTEIRIFLLSIKAGGTGLNLTAADYVFLLDPWWNPAIESQAIDRAHRIGQTKNVIIYKFITEDSVEERIMKLQDAKKSLVSSLITTEESFMKALTEADILSILE